jgi:hypothetical protein
MNASGRFALALVAATFGASAAKSATFGDLSGGASPQTYGAGLYAAGPYAASPYSAGPYAAANAAPCPCPPAPAYGSGPAYAPALAYGRPGGYGSAGSYAEPYPGVPAPLDGYGAGPYAGIYPGAEALAGGSPLSGGPEGAPPRAFDPPNLSPPIGPSVYPLFGPGAGLPNGSLRLETFQQINSTTDPYNAWGLSTPFMFVPWSTPLSGWTNAQTWNWWRERSGAPPYGW